MKAAQLLCASMVAVIAAGAKATGPAQPAAAPELDATTFRCAGESTSALSAFHPLPSRSPAGLLYERPRTLGSTREGSGWSIAGCAELGSLVGDSDERSAQFRKYRDFGGRDLIGAFSLVAEPPGRDRFIEVDGGTAGRNDQYVDLRAARYNDWSLSAYYRASPQVFSDSFRSLWSGVGSAELRLADPVLTPGGLASASDTQAALRGVLAGTPMTALDVQRRKTGLAVNGRPTESWRVFLSLASEQRQGAIPSGAVFGGGDGGGNVTVPQSVDDASHLLSAGASYADALTSFNVALSAALYRNRVGAMVFENPLTITPDSIAAIGAGAFKQGRLSLDPDNDYGSARLDFARSFPQWFGARITASLALGRLRQNETLSAPTALPLTGATLHGVPADEVWNTTAALTRTSAEAQIDNRVAVLTASVQPLRGLLLTGRFRDDSTDNDTDYLACNPLTGQVGRLLNDGSGAAVVDVPQYLPAGCDLAAIRAMGITPDAGDVTLGNASYEQRNRDYGLTAHWRLEPGSSLTTELGRYETSRAWRERESTWEDRLKLSYVELGLPDASLHASVEYAERGGSAYRSGANADRRSASLGPPPSSGNASTWFGTVDELRKFDLADRTRTTVRLRGGLALREGLDAGISFSGRYARYPQSGFGRNGREKWSSVSLDANYVAADGLTLRGFYTFQSSGMRQSGAQPAGCIIGVANVTAGNFQQCGAFGGPLFPS